MDKVMDVVFLEAAYCMSVGDGWLGSRTAWFKRMRQIINDNGYLS